MRGVAADFVLVSRFWVGLKRNGMDLSNVVGAEDGEWLRPIRSWNVLWLMCVVIEVRWWLSWVVVEVSWNQGEKRLKYKNKVCCNFPYSLKYKCLWVVKITITTPYTQLDYVDLFFDTKLIPNLYEVYPALAKATNSLAWAKVLHPILDRLAVAFRVASVSSVGWVRLRAALHCRITAIENL